MRRMTKKLTALLLFTFISSNTIMDIDMGIKFICHKVPYLFKENPAGRLQVQGIYSGSVLARVKNFPTYEECLMRLKEIKEHD